MGRLMIDPGELTQRITLQVRASGQDALGQANGAWGNVPTDPTVWAKPGFVTARDIAADIAAAGQQIATLDAKWFIRYRADVLPSWRVLWNSQPFELVGRPINVDGMNEWLQLLCVAGVRDGR